ncbi:FAR1-related sequence 5-like protein [Tanacetum coccineum]
MEEEIMEEVTECMRTPRPTLYEQTDTPGGSIYWEPHVDGIPIPVEGNSYGSIDEAFHMYVKYAEMAGFEVKKGGQKKTKSGAVLNKYIYCNKEGVPKPININTLDPQYQKQKRNTTTHATGCKAHIRLVLNIVSGRYKLETFNPKHNHMLIPKEYRHFTKKQRKMNQSEKMFVVKALQANKIGATQAQLCIVNKSGVMNSSWDVMIVDNDELVCHVLADMKAPNVTYKAFGELYNMKFVPFIGIDNHGKCVTLGSGMLLHEDTKSYTWLLTAFMSAFLKEPTMIVTDQDGAMKRAIEAVFKKAKHRLCMWHIMQKIPTKVLLNIEDGSVNRDIKVIPKQYILRRWTRDIIPPDLRRKENRYGEKNVNIQRLTNEANFLVDDTLFLLSKDEEKMGTYVTNLKKLLDDVKTDMPNPPSRDTVIEDVFSVKQTNDVQVKNPTKAVNKGEHLKKGERLKSEREKAIKVAKKKARPCGFCKEVTNEHTKLTCPLNPNARKKRKATPVIDV